MATSARPPSDLHLSVRGWFPGDLLRRRRPAGHPAIDGQGPDPLGQFGVRRQRGVGAVSRRRRRRHGSPASRPARGRPGHRRPHRHPGPTAIAQGAGCGRPRIGGGRELRAARHRPRVRGDLPLVGGLLRDRRADRRRRRRVGERVRGPVGDRGAGAERAHASGRRDPARVLCHRPGFGGARLPHGSADAAGPGRQHAARRAGGGHGGGVRRIPGVSAGDPRAASGGRPARRSAGAGRAGRPGPDRRSSACWRPPRC